MDFRENSDWESYLPPGVPDPIAAPGPGMSAGALFFTEGNEVIISESGLPSAIGLK
jgi:hypothetical protein